MTIPRLRRSPPEPVDVDAAELDLFAEAVAECGDPVKAGRSLGMGPVKSAATMLHLRRRMGSQAG